MCGVLAPVGEFSVTGIDIVGDVDEWVVRISDGQDRAMSIVAVQETFSGCGRFLINLTAYRSAAVHNITHCYNIVLI